MRNSCPTVTAAVVIAILLIPSAARAQAEATESSASAAVFDATGYVAWVRGNRGGIGGDTFRDWYTTGLLGAGIGHYWTEHLKTEAEFTSTGRGTLVSFEDLDGPLLFSRAVYRNHSYQVRTLSLVQSYQFRHNAWVHPFIGAGLDLDSEQRTIDGSVQTIDSRGDQVIVTNDPLPREEQTHMIARAIAIAGFKAYVARRAYLRTDVRASVTDGLDQVAWRFGFGWDF